MHTLSSSLRAYPWGSRTLLAELQGRPSPAAGPEAELWFGAHPAAPSLIAGRPLTEIIAADPEGALSADVADRFGGRLPFLLKLLAAGEPLSLQAHPSLAQARAGFAEEEAARIDITSPQRSYRDDNHKPELLVALTEFDAMCGFRPLDQTRELFATLQCPELDRYLTVLDSHAEDSLRALFTTWITIPAAARHTLIDAVLARAAAVEPQVADSWHGFVLRNILQLGERYPGDGGILGALLLNHVRLQPGEGIFLDAGQLHAYLCGLGVEIMANSDNVLRGGLTTKHVDVPQLAKVLTFAPLEDPVRHAKNGEYPVPVEDFRLFVDTADGQRVQRSGPAILLCTRGVVRLAQNDETLELSAGEAAWLAASDPAVTVTGGGQYFLATV